MQVGYRHKSRFWSNSWLSNIARRTKCQKHLPTTQMGIWHSRGHAPLAIDRLLDVRTMKWQKPFPTTMQCRSHSRNTPLNVCLWRPAAWTNTPKRTEKNLIVRRVRSGISEAETTNNKRLRSTFCIEVIQTRSITRPLCDSRASCPLRHIETENFQPHARPWSLSAHHMRLKLEGDHEAAVMIVHRKC